MKPKFEIRTAGIVVFSTVLAATVSMVWQASASNIAWDITPGAVGAGDGAITGGAGTWNTTLGNWTSDSGVNNIAWNNSNNDTAIFGGTAGTVTLGAPVTVGGIAFNSGYTLSGDILTLAGTTTVTAASGVTGTISSVIAGSTGFTKTGLGTVSFEGGTLAKTYSGSTTVNAGILSAGYGTFATDNLIPSTSPLVLNGGALQVLLSSGTSRTQTFGGTTVNPGNSAVQLNKGGSSGTAKLVLGTITRNSGGLLNVHLSHTGSNRLIQSSSWTSGQTITDSGVAYATFVQTGSTSTTVFTANDWAAYSGTTVQAAGYTPTTATTLVGNADVATTVDTTLTASATITTLRDILNENRTINIGSGNTLTTGGILIGSPVTGTVTITGGTLRSAATAANKDLVVISHGGTLLVNSAISDVTSGATGLTKSGAGSLLLAGANAYTGPTIINGGSVQFAKTASLYNGTNSSWTEANLSVSSGSTLAFNVGGTGEFSTGNVTTLLGNLGGLGGAVNNNGLQSGSIIGFDTTNASGGTFTVADNLTDSTGTGGGLIGVAKNGAGILILSGSNSFTGGFNLNAGTVNVQSSTAFGTSAGGVSVANGAGLSFSGGVNVVGEPLSISGSGVSIAGAIRNVSGNNSWTGLIALPNSLRITSNSGTLTLGSATIGTRSWIMTGPGNITVEGDITGTSGGVLVDNLANEGIAGGTMTLKGANTYTGATTVTNGKLILSGNRTTTATSGIVVGNGANGTTQTGTLEISNGTFTIATSFIVGSGENTINGIVNQTGGNLTVSGNLQLLLGNGGAGTTTGTASYGTYNLSNGTLASTAVANRGIILGVNAGATGTFNLSGTGNVAMGTTSNLQIGRSDAAATGTTGVFNQTGGTAAFGTLTMGGGSGAGFAGTTGTLSLTGGTFSAGAFAFLSAGDSSTSTITIGGTADVTLPAFPTGLAVPVPMGAGSTSYVTFDGGTLHPLAASTTYMGGLTEVTIKSNGAKFDVASGNDITIAQNLLTHATSTGGGLTKTGAGNLTLSGTNTYSGPTTVNAGTLSLGNINTNNEQSIVTIAGSGAQLQLTFVGTDTVKKLFIGTSQKPAGIYGHSSTGVNNGGLGVGALDAYFASGTGTLTVTSSPAGYSSWAGLNGAGSELGDDHDSDGVKNGVEYFIGGPTGNTTGFTVVPSVINNSGVLSITWVKSGNYTGTYGTDFSVETSSTLAAGSWTTAASSGTSAIPNTVFINGNNVTYTFPAGTNNFARLKITGP